MLNNFKKKVASILATFSIALLLISCSLPLEQAIGNCKISYSSEYDTVPQSKEVVIGTTLTAEDLPTLSHDGYIFLGWHDGDNEIKVGMNVTKDLKLVAKWEKTYTVTFVTDKGTAPDPIKGIRHNTSLTNEQLKPLSFTDYAFKGWYDGETKVTNTYKITKDVTLTAKWEYNPVYHSITYETAHGTAPETIKVVKGSEITDANLLKLPVTDGLNFAGWFNGDSRVYGNYIVNSDITLTASWKTDEELYQYVYDNLKLKNYYINTDEKVELPPKNIDGVDITIIRGNGINKEDGSINQDYRPSNGNFNRGYLQCMFKVGSIQEPKNIYYYIYDCDTEEQYDEYAINEVSKNINGNFTDKYNKRIDANITKLELFNLSRFTDVIITYKSSNEAILGNDLYVKHTNNDEKFNVKLTITIKRNKERQLTFDAVVLNTTPENKKKVDDALNSISIVNEVSEDTTSIDLPNTAKGFNVTWTSNKPQLISNDGKITHDESKAGTKTVRLTAAIESGNYRSYKDYYLSVHNYQNVNSQFEIYFIKNSLKNSDVYVSEGYQVRIFSPNKTNKTIKIAYGLTDSQFLEYNYSAKMKETNKKMKMFVKLTYNGNLDQLPEQSKKYANIVLTSKGQLNDTLTFESSQLFNGKQFTVTCKDKNKAMYHEVYGKTTKELMDYSFPQGVNIVHLNQDNINDLTSTDTQTIPSLREKFINANCNFIFIVDEGVTTITQHAFSGLPTAEIFLPKSLTKIDNYAFKNIKIPDTELILYFDGGTTDQWIKLTHNVDTGLDLYTKIICADTIM